MQAAKDSFYMALRDRLAALNPARTLVRDGVTVPAIAVRENLEPRFTEVQAGVFYVEFGELLVAESSRPMLGMDCRIWYASEGTAGGSGVDRGRVLAEMDQELIRICNPPHTEMLDYTQIPAEDLGAGVFWTLPELGDAPDTKAGKQQRGASAGRIARQAQLRIYFFLPEAGA